MPSILFQLAWDPRYIAMGRTHRKHRFHHYPNNLLQRRAYLAVTYKRQVFYCCLRIRCGGNVIIEPFPSNGHLLWLHYSGV
jgi:hypothetical protein